MSAIAVSLTTAKTLDSVAKPFELGYQPWLDGLRGVSILLVLSVHMRLIAPVTGSVLPAGGFLGVDVFFVISGFLITSLLLSEYQTTHNISLKSFYWRRALRLFPALLGVLLFTSLLAGLYGSFSALGLTPIRLASTLTYFTNWIRAYEGSETWLLFHFWSLSIEEQFYLIWPAVLLSLLWFKVRPAVITLLVIAAIVASVFLKLWLFDSGATVNRVYYGSDTRADSVLIGCLASLALSLGYIRITEQAQRLLSAMARAGVIIIFGFIVVSSDGFQPLYLGGLTLISLSVGAIVLHLTASPESAAARLLSNPSLVWIGKRSYGLYLWHWPMYEIARLLPGEIATAIAALVLTVCAASLSYRYIELPFLRIKARQSKALATGT